MIGYGVGESRACHAPSYYLVIQFAISIDFLENHDHINEFNHINVLDDYMLYSNKTWIKEHWLIYFYLALVVDRFERSEEVYALLAGPFEDPVRHGRGLVDVNRLVEISLREFFRGQEIRVKQLRPCVKPGRTTGQARFGGNN